MSKPARSATPSPAPARKRASKPRKVAPPDVAMLSPEPFQFRYNPNAKHPVHGCPFVQQTSDGALAPGGRFWSVPATGGYDPGWRVGQIMAAFYLRAISDKGAQRGGGSWLSAIVCDLFERLHAEADANDAPKTGDRYSFKNSEAYHSLRGQLLGFLQTIEQAAAAGATAHPSHFTEFDTDRALRLATIGLTIDGKEWQRLQMRLYKAKDAVQNFPGA